MQANGEWNFVKGVIEKGETPYEAAIREVKEETSISDLRFCWDKVYTQTKSSANQSHTYYFLASSSRSTVVLPISEELGKPENDRFEWLSFDAANELLAPTLRDVLNWAERIVARSKKPTTV